jgi:hypothetical protein
MEESLIISKTLEEVGDYKKPKKTTQAKSKQFDLFDFLANVNLDELCKSFPNSNLAVEKPVEKPVDNIIKKRKKPIIAKPFEKEEPINQETKEELNDIFEEVFGNKKYKCPACTKFFSTESCLKRHYTRFPVCKDWSSLAKESDCKKLNKGIHLVILDVLDDVLKSENNLECKYCKITFTNKGNHHKHYNSATACNRLAYKDFVKAISSL